MRFIAILFLLCCTTTLSARQLYTVQAGNWYSDSVWYNQVTPSVYGDTIRVYHALTIDSDLVIDNGTYLFIDSGGGICGNVSFYINQGAKVRNEGYLGFLFIRQRDTVFTCGCIDVGKYGGVLEGPLAYFHDSLGYMLVHEGNQVCPFPCIENDTTLLFDTAGLTVTFYTPAQAGVVYIYDFVPGYADDKIQYAGSGLSYTFSSPGTYKVLIVYSSCCHRDSLWRTISFPAPPPPCVETENFAIYPTVANNDIWIEKDFCLDEPVQVKIFALSGQLTAEYFFNSNNKHLLQKIGTQALQPAGYIVQAKCSHITTRQKVIIINE